MAPRPPATRLVLPALCSGYFVVLLDVTVVNVALPSIGHDLGAGVAGLQWVVDGYAVALAALLLAAGTAGDVVGHRRIVLVGLATFGLASLGCGLAPSTAVLVGGRVAQGIGAALLLPGTLALLGDAIPGKAEQARAVGIWAAVGSAALPAGPLLGGVLVQAASWRLVFLVNVPIVVAAAAAVTVAVPPGRRDTGRRVDVPGAVAGAVALAGAVLAVVAAGGGRAATAALGGVVAIGATCALLAVERRSPDPMLPPALLRERAFVAANGVAGTMNLATLGMLFLVTLYLQTVQHRSALAAGVALLPLFLPLTLMAAGVGRVVGRVGPRVPAAVGLGVAAGGFALLLPADASTPYVVLLPALLLWGIGLGVLTPAIVTAALRAVPPERSGLASGANNTARQAAGAIGIAVYGAVAGAPTHAARFLSGLHAMAACSVVLYLAAAAVTVRWVAVRSWEPSR
ncbi:MFS transporter [Nocardioides sp. YIM 152315]|uniref:MFS transporter n=1 Tax=Nocardioides sp. YIM 152315 TaxID=3031760 RepID=UPI0023D9D51B|nr:MFS transporter [Nocardioides sp. YIM 152315]MDF1602084.1 MFS transporter [Nocardioides sp. YIM 152315]